jgi:hypothetical protein
MPHTGPAAPPDAPRTLDEVLTRYRELRSLHQIRFDALHTRQRRGLAGIAATLCFIAWQTDLSMHGARAAWPLLLGFVVLAGLVVWLVRLQHPMDQERRLLIFYDRSRLRADGSEMYSDRTGEDAFLQSEQPHLYQRDLDILGPQSLFARLATVRTGVGERGLARYLLETATHHESVLRQQAVRELLPQTELRERIALLGQSSFEQISASFFDQWIAEQPPIFHPAFRYLLAATSAVSVAFLLAGLFRLVAWSDLVPNLTASLALQGAMAIWLRKRVMPLLEGGARLQSQVRLFAEGLALLQSVSFTSTRLVELQRLSREPAGAVKLLRRLDGWLLLIEQRSKELFFVFSLLTAAGCQAAIAVAEWKRTYATSMRQWLDVWAEFEALNALATYAFENPEDAWPELLPPEAEPVFESRELGHPLLPSAVRNNIALGGPHPAFFLISGSNMAGKSTLMRSIGINAVLAYAGAPVRASMLRLTPLTLGASIALTDSLAEGKSKFLAEVERLGSIVSASESGAVLFLVDEIFSGTNSLDRGMAAQAVLSRLLGNGAIGALSTHDLALTSLASEESHGKNVHMASPDPADPLAFDYILKPGINTSSNALAIIRLIGLEP